MNTSLSKYTLWVLLFVCLGIASAGNLNPPSAPGSTMKTLDEVQPRTPIGQRDIPLTISTSGSYYLTENVTSTFSQGAILIAADNVTLDLCGFTVTGSGSSANYGVVMSGRTNIEVKNGTFTGFVYGIANTSSKANNYQIVNVHTVANRRGGISLYGYSHSIIDCVAVDNGNDSSGGWGISVIDHSIVRHCTVSGNGTAISGYLACGITTGQGCIIEGNTVYNNGCNSDCSINAGIYTGNACTIKDNTVYGNACSTTGTGKSYGIFTFLGSVINGNTTYGNGNDGQNAGFYGIYAYLGCTVKGNTAYNNGANAASPCWGIYAYNLCTVDQNTAYMNTGTNLYTGPNCALGVNCSL